MTTLIYAVVNPKGGTGKTTLTANLGALLADLGLNVLLIDADPGQPSLSRFFPLATRAQHGLTRLITTQSLTPTVVSQVHLPDPECEDPRLKKLRLKGRLDLVYSDAGTELQIWLAERIDYFKALSLALSNPEVASTYNVVLIDTQGAQGKVQDAAWLAADQLITPVSPDTISATELFSGFAAQMQRMGHVRPHPPMTHVVINKQTRTTDARRLTDQIRDAYFDLRGTYRVASAAIPAATAFNAACTARTPVHWHDPARASLAMHRLVWELLPQFDGLFAGNVERSSAQMASEGTE